MPTSSPPRRNSSGPSPEHSQRYGHEDHLPEPEHPGDNVIAYADTPGDADSYTLRERGADTEDFASVWLRIDADDDALCNLGGMR